MRGKKAPRRTLAPDYQYGSADIAKLINMVMQRGKKTVAEKIVYQALDHVSKTIKQDPKKVFHEALKQVGPGVEIRSRRVGGANYQVPFPTSESRKMTLAFRWLIGAARDMKGKPMYLKLAQVLMDGAKGEGAAVKKRMDVHRMAEANKAFAHFARYG